MNDAHYAKIREYTCKLIDGMDDGTVDPRAVADMALGFLSEDDVKQMCLSNDMFVDEDEDDVGLDSPTDFDEYEMNADDSAE